MQGSKRLAAVGAVLALGALGAAGTAAASAAPATVHVAAAASTTKHYTQADVAALAAHLPKGVHVKLVSDQSSITSDGIVNRGCTAGWGVEVIKQGGACTSYGYAGTTAYLGYYATTLYTNNNYGSITFNKDLGQYNGDATEPCEVWEFNTGTYSTALLQYVSISSWTDGLVCDNYLDIYW